MVANFYNNSGVMMGVDLHIFWELAPTPPTFGIPWPVWPYIVGVGFSWWPATFWKRTGTVTSDTHKMIQGGFDLYLVPHFPMPLLPWGGPQPMEMLKIHAAAGSKAQLTAHSVTGEGSPLATCILGADGYNVNCQEFGLSAPTGIVQNINSVETSPTVGDYVGAVIGWAVDAALGFTMRKFPESAKHLWRRVGDIPFLKVHDVPSQTQNFVQRWIDGSFDDAVNQHMSDMKDANDPNKAKSDVNRIVSTFKDEFKG